MLELYVWLVIYDSRFASLIFPLLEFIPGCSNYLFKQHPSPKFITGIWIVPSLINIGMIILSFLKDRNFEETLKENAPE